MPFLDLPDGIIEEIGLRLPPASMCLLQSTCRHLKMVLQQDRLYWLLLFKQYVSAIQQENSFRCSMGFNPIGMFASNSFLKTVCIQCFYSYNSVTGNMHFSSRLWHHRITQNLCLASASGESS